MLCRRKGFTLIELLVVIAIIGILAAMLFPVFARARESARKTQCLSNVKNIAMAVQMYLSDYDAFPTNNHDSQLLAFLNQQSSSGNGCYNGTSRFNGANPYLRWPVVLDEYIKNRDVWRCPSMQHVSTATWIVPQLTPVWWDYLRQNQGRWGSGSQNSAGCGGGPCCQGWPTGWGGTVTDSIVQQKRGSDSTGAFVISIGVNDTCLAGRPVSDLDDPSAWVVCADNQQGYSLGQMFGAIYGSKCCWNLTSYSDCKAFYQDPSYREKYAPHMGGLNIGFADGHAQWWPGEEAWVQAGYCGCCGGLISNCDSSHAFGYPVGKLKGMCPNYEVLAPGIGK